MAIKDALNIIEVDGSPSTYPYQLKVTNGTLTDNSDGTATLTIAGGAPGGSNTQVQFNDSSAFGGDAGLVYNKTTDTLSVLGGLVVGDNTATNRALTFDTLPSYGTDPTITALATTNVIELKAPGINNAGSLFQPLVDISPSYASAAAWVQVHSGSGGGLCTLRYGADSTLIAFIGGRVGTSAGCGMGFYGTAVFPITIPTADTSGGATANGTIDFGASGIRWANVYSVLGNFSGIVTAASDVKLTTAGGGLYVKEGSNATMGVATLSGGTVTVSTTKAAANSRIFLTTQTLGTVTVPKTVGVTARSAGTSFTITSSDATDTSTVAWMIVEPA